MIVETLDRQAELLAAIERFMSKLRQIESGIELTLQETEWLQMFRKVHGKYARYIGPLDSWMLSCSAVWICVREGNAEIAYECDKAHYNKLRPRRRKKPDISINDDRVDEPADNKEVIDDAVIEVLRSLGPDDELLLRRRYFDDGDCSTKTLAKEAGVSDEAMRQRLARAMKRLKQTYERVNCDEQL